MKPIFMNSRDFGCEKKLPFKVYFFTRLGGRSEKPYDSLNLSFAGGDDSKAVAANEKAALDAMGVSRMYLPKQVHSAEATVLDHAPPFGIERGPDADAVITSLRGVGIGVLTADCVPVLIGHAKGLAVAAVHAGWRGLVGGVIASVMKSIVDAGIAPEELTAFIGPAIGPCCYEVSPDVSRAFAEAFPPGDEIVLETSGKITLDLPAAARRSLLDAGMRDNEIYLIGRCTACETGSFYSHRRESGVTGRLLSAIVIK